MATYFHGGQDIQPDGLQTLYLMNPGFGGYSDAEPVSTNMVLLNSAASSLSRTSFQQANQTRHLVGIPLQAPVPSSIHGSQELSAVQGLTPRVHYNVWTPIPSNNSMDRSSQLGISLGLSPRQGSGIVDPISNGGSGTSLQSGLVGSKYLKVAQQLLDEVVKVGKGVEGGHSKGYIGKNQVKLNGGYADEIDTNERRDAELTVAEKQELQMKKVKLANMFDEVEQRYRQYRHHMQIVVSSFEAVTGFGSAKTYTSLALQTISKQFRCLRDSISGQIRAASKSLGEDFNGVSKSTGSRLRFVDHQLRQQRALQQLGVMQHSAWRPQRGLPERAVSVLRAWLFEHFLHPYPKDSDKHLLAKQTGLTRSQVSNWFINARVRLWKPMVEEMYMEETKEQELNKGVEKSRKRDTKEESSTSKSSASQENNPGGTELTGPMPASGYDDEEAPRQPTVKKARTDHPPHFLNDNLKLKERSNQEVLVSFEDGNQTAQGNSEYPNAAGYGSYSVGDISRFDPAQFSPRFFGNGFSLSLGLPHSESLSVSRAQASYISTESIPLGRRLEISSNNSDYSSMNDHPTLAHTSNPYESIKMQRGERFAAQLLPDFVA